MHSEPYTTVAGTPADPRPEISEKPMDTASKVKSGASNPERSADKNGGHPDGYGDGSGRAGGSGYATQPSLSRGPRVARAAHAAANTLSNTAEYIRKHDAASMMADAKRLVKDNPAFALLGAAVIGFALARIWSRD
jgi:hypothetical protein